MGILEFVNKVERALVDYYGESAEIKMQSVYKNNGLLLHGICVLKKGKNIAPTIYLNQFYDAYQEGECLGEIVRKVIQIIEENQVSKSLNVNFFLDYKKVKKRLVLRLINLEENKELLKEVPYRKFMDLAVVCHCVIVTREIGSGAILIQRQHMEAWNIDEETLFRDAFWASPRVEPYQIMKMGEMLKSILAEKMIEEADIKDKDDEEARGMLDDRLEQMENEVDKMDIPMYVLTNYKRYYGAACIAYPQVVERIADMLQDDYYIIPSSVHEILFISKKDCIDSDRLNRIIEDVNWSQVAEEDWLSNHTYLYSRKEKTLLPIITS